MWQKELQEIQMGVYKTVQKISMCVTWRKIYIKHDLFQSQLLVLAPQSAAGFHSVPLSLCPYIVFFTVRTPFSFTSVNNSCSYLLGEPRVNI